MSSLDAEKIDLNHRRVMEALAELAAEQRVATATLTEKIHSLELGQERARGEVAACMATHIVSEKERTTNTKRIETLETSDRKQEVRWGKIIGYAAGAGLASGGAVAGLLQLLGLS